MCFLFPQTFILSHSILWYLHGRASNIFLCDSVIILYAMIFGSYCLFYISAPLHHHYTFNLIVRFIDTSEFLFLFFQTCQQNFKKYVSPQKNLFLAPLRIALLWWIVLPSFTVMTRQPSKSLSLQGDRPYSRSRPAELNYLVPGWSGKRRSLQWITNPPCPQQRWSLFQSSLRSNGTHQPTCMAP